MNTVIHSELCELFKGDSRKRTEIYLNGQLTNLNRTCFKRNMRFGLKYKKEKVEFLMFSV